MGGGGDRVDRPADLAEQLGRAEEQREQAEEPELGLIRVLDRRHDRAQRRAEDRVRRVSGGPGEGRLELGGGGDQIREEMERLERPHHDHDDRDDREDGVVGERRRVQGEAVGPDAPHGPDHHPERAVLERPPPGQGGPIARPDVAGVLPHGLGGAHQPRPHGSLPHHAPSSECSRALRARTAAGGPRPGFRFRPMESPPGRRRAITETANTAPANRGRRPGCLSLVAEALIWGTGSWFTSCSSGSATSRSSCSSWWSPPATRSARVKIKGIGLGATASTLIVGLGAEPARGARARAQFEIPEFAEHGLLQPVHVLGRDEGGAPVRLRACGATPASSSSSGSSSRCSRSA